MAHKCQKLALLVGCNYPNSENELYGCINDVMVVHDALVTPRFGFDSNCVEIMIDDQPGSEMMPTGANIKKSLSRMVDQAKPGDILFFHFSGHGMKIPSTKTPNKEEEVIVPCDKNIITCVDFRVLVNRVPAGATFTFCMDSCNSGGLIDKENEQIGTTHTHPPQSQDQSTSSPKRKLIPYESMLQQLTTLTGLNSPDIGVHLLHMFGSDASLMFRIPTHQFPIALKPDQGILFSACRSDESATEVKIEGKYFGSFTYAQHEALKEQPGPLSNKQLVLLTRQIFISKKLNPMQHPCLYCSDENVDAIFLSQATP